MKTLAPLLALFLTLASAPAEETLSASDLAATLAKNLNSGVAEIRLRMKTEKPAQVLQLRIRQRWTENGADAVYEILFPKDRTGEKVIINQSGDQPASATWHPIGGTPKPLTASDALFESDLAIADAVENFYAWKNQSLAGSDKIGNVDCTILESKPSSGSIYGKVRSWIDIRRMVPLRVEKYSRDGALVRRIETTRVVPDSGKSIPGDLRVEHGDTRTELDGSRIRHTLGDDVDFGS